MTRDQWLDIYKSVKQIRSSLSLLRRYSRAHILIERECDTIIKLIEDEIGQLE